MTYDELRHLADSWGLVVMAVMFATFIGWTFRPGSNQRHDEAANMIFTPDARGDDDHGA